MKKLLALLLTLMMTLSLAACGEKETATSDVYTTEDQAGSETATETPAEEMVVGFIFVGPIGDGGWTYAHNEGRLYLEQELGVKTLYKESVPEDQAVEQEMRNMIDQGAKVIFATSFGYMDYMKRLSSEYPEVAFLHCSGYETTENMANYFGRIYEARYLSGIVAGMKTESNKIGYVAAFPIPEVIRGINAFTLGAQSVNPDVEVEVVWTSTWYDPAVEKAAAVSLLDGGADIIAQHQDTAGPQQAAEERGAFSIGYNTDMSAMAPGSYMTAPIWNWGPYYVEQVKAVMAGTFASHSYWEGMNEGIVALAPLTANAPEGAQAAVDEAAAKILDGSLVVFAGPIKGQDGSEKVAEGAALTDGEMLSMDWFVQGVVGTIE